MEVPPLAAGLDGRDADPGPGRVRAPFVPGMPRLRTDPEPDRLMTGTDNDAAQGNDEGAGATGPEHSRSEELTLAGWSVLHAAPVAPPWMRAELVRLQAAFPEFSFNICPGWRGLTFEAWRDPGAGGVYAVITRNAAELWRELEKSRDGLRPAADTCKKRRDEGPQADPRRDAGRWCAAG